MPGNTIHSMIIVHKYSWMPITWSQAITPRLFPPQCMVVTHPGLYRCVSL